MLKICGITYAHSPNYGSCMQAYALQTAIEDLDICGEQCSYQLIPVQMFKDYPKNGLNAKIAKPLLKWQRRSFRSFYSEHMKFASVDRMSDLSRLNSRYDAFVCGSDVIWNDSFNQHVGAYFLDFAEKYKFSYAASFGKSEISPEYVRWIGDKVDRLDSISVREPSAVALANRLTAKKVRVVADPVLLLKREQWDILAPDRVANSRYIFVYATHLNENLHQFIEKVKKETGCSVVFAVAGPKQAIKMKMKTIHTPLEWLSLLKNAEYVVTNSFHATAFSTIYHKKFFTVVNGEKTKGINIRMNDYLTTLGLQDRIFSSIPEQLDMSEIDFMTADEKIAQLREESLVYLRENLEAAYRQKTLFAEKEII